MSYTAWSVIAGEQPTTAKWNILGTNDQSFNNGTGFGNGVIPGTAIAPGALLLGSTAITSNFAPGTTALTDITGLSLTVTVPAGGRDIAIVAHAHMYNTSSADNMVLYVREGSTTLDSFKYRTAALNSPELVEGTAHVAAAVATAGSHTYKLSMSGGAANPVIEATATETSYIAVYAV